MRVALIGNPNTGKSTLFNALAGMNARVGNYPGVTVEKKTGRVTWHGQSIELIDLPGTYSLSPRTLDEMVSVEVLLGRQSDVGQIDAVVCIADATNLERNFYLLSQLLDVGLPTLLVLNMWDVAQAKGIRIDAAQLSQRLGIPVVVTSAQRKRGVDDVIAAFENLASSGKTADRPKLFRPEFYAACDELDQHLQEQGVKDTPFYLIERLILDVDGQVEAQFAQQRADGFREELSAIRQRLRDVGFHVPVVEPKVRYAWAKQILAGVVDTPSERRITFSDRVDNVLTQRFGGLIVFALVMFLVFQAIYSWAQPMMDACEAAQGWVASNVESLMAPGPLRSLLVDGVVAGVGGVLIFLPQISLLFFFIAILEDCGYMARAAFVMDKVMTKFGLSGKSFVPLMSSFACAIPGVMATRVIENRRDRMITILVAPLMSCSARLPVYLLLIAAFIPKQKYLSGLVTLHGVVLFAMYSLGVLVAIGVALLLKTTLFRGESSVFVMELPQYTWPSPRMVLFRVYDRGKAFVVRAGTLIFATTILVWAAGYFPGDHSEQYRVQSELEALGDDAQEEQVALLRRQHNAESGRLIEQSVLGRLGRTIEPAVKPLGWDWRIGVGVIASFPAREVIISTMGTIYSLGGDIDEEDEGLRGAMQAAKWPDGRPVYTVPVALSIMVFFALCAQCASTLMVIRRETNSWGWPVFCFVYMTGLAYLGGLATYQIGMLFYS